MGQRQGMTISQTPAALGSFFMILGLVVYVFSEVMGSINLAGATAATNTSIAAITVAGYGALGMAVIIGIMIVANILMGLMRGMAGTGQ